MARGHYTFEQIKRMDAEEILFLNHYQELNIQMQHDFITNALGVVWDKKDFAQQLATTKSMTQNDINRLFVPLSVAINPQVIDYVHSQFNITGITKDDGSLASPFIGGGSYNLKPGESVKSMADMSKEQFIQAIGGWGNKSNVIPHKKPPKPHEGSFTSKKP